MDTKHSLFIPFERGIRTQEEYNMKSRIAVALANSISDGLMFSGGITDSNVGNELFDTLADLLAQIPDDKLLRLFTGVYHNVRRQRSELSAELARDDSTTELARTDVDEWGTSDSE